LPASRKEYLGIAIIAIIISTALVYIHATRPSREKPLKLTLFRYPDELFGVREESPSMTVSLVCQKKIGVLDIRFISTVQDHGLDELLGHRFEDPASLLEYPPMCNLSELFEEYDASPRTLRTDVEIDGKTLSLYTFDFDLSSGGLVQSGPFLVYDFLFNATGHLVGFFRGAEDFFVRPEDTLEYIGVQVNQNITEYFWEKREGSLSIADRPLGGLVRLQDLSPGDVISINMRWKPNMKSASREAKDILSGRLFLHRVEVLADGSPVDLGLGALVIRNLG